MLAILVVSVCPTAQSVFGGISGSEGFGGGGFGLRRLCRARGPGPGMGVGEGVRGPECHEGLGQVSLGILGFLGLFRSDLGVLLGSWW